MEENFEQIVKSYLPALRKMVKNIGELPGWVDKEDILSEMLCHVWQAWKNGYFEGKSRSYVLKSCWFVAKNYLRKVREKINLVSVDEPLNEQHSCLKDIIEQQEYFFSLFELREGLRELEKRLTKKEKEVLELQKREYTTREAAKVLGISHVMVGKVQKRIREKAQKIL